MDIELREKINGVHFDVFIHGDLCMFYDDSGVGKSFLFQTSNFAHSFCQCTLKIQYLAGIQLSKFPLFCPYAA